MVTASAPGKVYLFGEHAVVYGEPAVPCAIERRAHVTVEPRSDARVRVQADDLRLEGLVVEYEGDLADAVAVDAPRTLAEAATSYVGEAVAQARAAADAPEAGVDVHVDSKIPLGAGLGSSAAVTVAAIAAGVRALGGRIEPAELAERSYRVEREVQAGGASRSDTFCSTMGGAVRVEGEDCRRLDAPELPFVVGFDGGAGDTGELVAGVRELREEYDFAADTVRAIGDLVRRGESALAAGDLAELGRLMDVDHGLLSALGVSARSLDAMVWAAREAGAHGAKLTGAGGGGCIVALDDSATTLRALELTPDCEAAFRAELAEEGVRIEDAPAGGGQS
jgi:mevalonate kinase